MDDELDKIAKGKSDTRTAMAVFAVTMRQTRDDVKDVKTILTTEYASKEFVTALFNSVDARVKMLERIVYGAVGLILVMVFGALITFALRKP